MVCDDGAGERVEYQITIKVNKKNLIEDLSTFFYKVRKGLGHFAAFLILGIFSTLTYFMYLCPMLLFFLPSYLNNSKLHDLLFHLLVSNQAVSSAAISQCLALCVAHTGAQPHLLNE